MRTLQQEFSGIEIGRSSEFRNLILFPLMRRSDPVRGMDYILLEDGIAQGKVRVTELHAGGSVPELRLENDAELPVLLEDGIYGAERGRSSHVFVGAGRTSDTGHGRHVFEWHAQV